MSNGRVYFFAPFASLAPPKHISFTGLLCVLHIAGMHP